MLVHNCLYEILIKFNFLFGKCIKFSPYKYNFDAFTIAFSDFVNNTTLTIFLKNGKRIKLNKNAIS